MSSTDTDIAMNTDDLYREEVVTDRRVGSIRVLYPITPDGSQDSNRSTQFLGQAQMLTPMGALPLSFEIEASSLSEAIEKFPAHANEALERAVKELQELRREQASSIVVPGAGGVPGGGGMPGGGKIQLK